jgi:hypothetical protein
MVLPEMLSDKVEAFSEARTGSMAEPKTDGSGGNQPSPSGFRLTGARLVGPLGHTSGTTFAIFRVDRFVSRETEPIQVNLIMVSSLSRRARSRRRC